MINPSHRWPVSKEAVLSLPGQGRAPLSGSKADAAAFTLGFDFFARFFARARAALDAFDALRRAERFLLLASVRLHVIGHR